VVLDGGTPDIGVVVSTLFVLPSTQPQSVFEQANEKAYGVEPGGVDHGGDEACQDTSVLPC